MTPFQEELYRLIQECKSESTAFTSSDEDASNEITKLIKFSQYWDYKDRFERVNNELKTLNDKYSIEKVDLENLTIKNLIKEWIPTIDDLYLLLRVSEKNTNVEKTIRLTLSNIEQFLMRRNGGIIFPKVNDEFDPVKHKAVSVFEDPEGRGNIIIEVFRPGYFVLGQVLREAEVKVRCGVKRSIIQP